MTGRGSTALVVVDMQNGFCHPDGSWAQAGYRVAPLAAAIEPCRRLVALARRAGVPTVFTQHLHVGDFPIVRHLFPELVASGYLAPGSWDSAIVDELRPAAADPVVTKTRYSAFWATPLLATLRERGLDTVMLCGILTGTCVDSTARDAAYAGLNAHVVADATADLDRDTHEHSLRLLATAFGWVTTLDEVSERWR